MVALVVVVVPFIKRYLLTLVSELPWRRVVWHGELTPVIDLKYHLTEQPNIVCYLYSTLVMMH